ncbi:putative sulfate/molybdate transporter [Natronomonas marina]|uniref:putative sulfate/molybdate transporter n=1 Tax=Natronomonas marina TaxID=2961939 RepID=UPI0020C9AB80|nr:putative sulfate/molybdate transporter [Natronomonas marina]
MATALPERRRFGMSAGELTGAIGDSVTVLPLVAALGVLTPASLPQVLAGFAVFQVVWGAVYGVPLSVEPMKALAGLAIAGAIGYGDLIAAGLLAGGVLLAAGRFGLLSRLASVVGEPVVRGVQFAVACLLVVAAADLVVASPTVAVAGVALAAAVAVVSPRAVAVVVLSVGLLWAVAVAGVPPVSLPAVGLFPAGGPTLSLGVVEGAVAQLAMTVGNAAVATSLLLSDLYEADVSPDRLAESMGAMNLLAVPLGAVPMCHGSGGLAGKHAFGARTATANVVAGCLYGGLAVVSGVFEAFPMALLGVLLVVVAVSLARVALQATDRRGFVVAVGVLAVLTNVGVAFVAGAAWWLARTRGFR